MLKLFRFNFFLFLVVLVLIFTAVFFVYFAFQDYFDKDRLSWQWDINYSNYLTTGSDHYEYMTGYKSATTVDGLMIIKDLTKDPKSYNLREILREEVILETQERPRIREFLLAAQEKWAVKDSFEASKGCHRESKNPKIRPQPYKFYAVMFDNTFNRAGYFLATLCKNHNKEYVQITVTDTNGSGTTVYYNDSLLPFFKPFLD